MVSLCSTTNNALGLVIYALRIVKCALDLVIYALHLVPLRGTGSFPQLEPLDGFSRVWLECRVLTQWSAFLDIDGNPQF